MKLPILPGNNKPIREIAEFWDADISSWPSTFISFIQGIGASQVEPGFNCPSIIALEKVVVSYLIGPIQYGYTHGDVKERAPGF